MSDLFIGVVSHVGSRYAVSQGPQGLGARLESALAGLGVSATVAVNTADAYSGEVTAEQVQSSLTAQLSLDRTWARYLGRPMGARWWAGHGLRWVRRAQQKAQPPDTRMVRRLLNIELSHVDLLRRACASGAAWALIIEDDADSPDVADLASGLAGLLASGSPYPAYVNISHSFSPSELGIRHLLSPAPDAHWAGTANRTVFAASKPVTNTVCAIVYRGTFLPALLAVFDALPMEPVVPIDWKLNLALMALFQTGELGPGSCWQVEPAPIVQMSMQVPA